MDSRHSTLTHSHSSGWAIGLVLILIGALFIVCDFSGITLQNWWALFILIPAFGAFGRAWAGFQSSGG